MYLQDCSEQKQIAVLFADSRGSYSDLPFVDLWDEERDARFYHGPYPVIAHPPCARWCRLAGFVESRTGHKEGEDYGCFEHALWCIRQYGGVLEHPAYSKAWKAYGLIPPDTKSIGWQANIDGSWVCHIEQGKYGHLVNKPTWLYVVGSNDLPSLEWYGKKCNPSEYTWRTRPANGRKQINKKQAIHTPYLFRDILISIAQGCTKSC